MKSLLYTLATAALIACCGDKKPAAQLSYERIVHEAPAYRVTFNSNMDIEALYSGSYMLTIVSKNLICALGPSTNFDIEDTMQYEFRGRIELQNKSRSPAGSYRYTSYGDFYENLRGGTEIKAIVLSELKKLLAGNEHIPCKVVMTVYGSTPYYSAPMPVPTNDILNAVIH